MTEIQKTGEGQTFELELVQSEKHFKYYANNAQLIETPWDFQIAFGEISKPDPDRKKMLVSQGVTIVMSPQHTKALYEILGARLADYENRVGEIKWQRPERASAKPEP